MSSNKHSQSLPVITDIIPDEPAEVTNLSEIELGLLQTQILWLLSRKSTHGYDLMKTLTLLRGSPMTQGTLYPTMQRLEELALVSKEAQERRIIYHMTEKGRKIMNQTCMAFVKTFYGIFHDYACERCDHYKAFSLRRKQEPSGNSRSMRFFEFSKKENPGETCNKQKLVGMPKDLSGLLSKKNGKQL